MISSANVSNSKKATITFLLAIALSTGSSSGYAQQDLSGELAVGSWFGKAVPDDPSTAPFPEVVMTPTFLADGTVIANDSHETTNPHATAHGSWTRTGENQIEATFVWLNLTTEDPTGFAGAFKVRLTGSVDPDDPDNMIGQVAPVVFPPGVDPLDPSDTGGIAAGVFTITELRRIRPDSDPTGLPGQQDLSSELAVGSWFGKAVPDDPSTAPFPEVVMTPTFLADGTVIANDSHETTNPHATAHGSWTRTGENQIEATFVWLNLTTEDPTGFAGAFKVRLTGSVDPDDPDNMIGQVAPVVFPPGVDPLDPNDTGGIPAGVFSITELRRVPADPFKSTAVVEELETAALPRDYGLDYAYPNPFNPTTTIRFSLPAETIIDLRIYNLQGQVVRHLVDERVGAGQFAVQWDGRNDSGKRLASGTYLYRLEGAGFSLQNKVTLLK